MRDPTEHFGSLVEIFNFNSKRQLERHCSRIIIHKQDLVALILAAHNGVIAPYKYVGHFARTLPERLSPDDTEMAALAKNGVGALRTKPARKCVRKLYQLFREQRMFAAHLFYTPSYHHWHLFYFDNRDTSKEMNHWKHGPHIHYVSDLWSGTTLESAWNQIVSSRLAFPSKLHIRYRQ